MSLIPDIVHMMDCKLFVELTKFRPRLGPLLALGLTIILENILSITLARI
jgi:hypothetical protein